MELNNEFHVSVPVDVAWAVLTDLERIAPCMPGAELQEVEGDEYRGIVKVKVGPISAQYKGTARFVEQDDHQHRAVLVAEGRDSRGQGNATAKVTATAVPDGTGTTVSLVTDLTVTGKVAQFGRSVMADVSARMLGEFARRLEADVLSQGSGPGPDESEPGSAAGAQGPEGAQGAQGAEGAQGAHGAQGAQGAGAGPRDQAVRTIHSAPAEPVDLLGAAGPSVLKRLVPLGALVGIVVWWWTRSRRKGRRSGMGTPPPAS